MNSKVDKAMKSLFPDQGDKAENVKFFLGEKRGVTAEELAGQLMRADSQIRNEIAVPTLKLDGELTTRTV